MNNLEVHNTLECFITLLPNVEKKGEQLLGCLRKLRNLCAGGKEIQDQIISNESLYEFIKMLLLTDLYAANKFWPQLQLMACQLLANTIVNNPNTALLVWQHFGQEIEASCQQPPLNKITDIKLMILYNIFQQTTNVISELLALQTTVRVWQTIIAEKYEENFEFLHFIFEHFLVTGGHTTVRCYAQLNDADRIAFLDYLSNYLRHDSPNGKVHDFLLQYISKEFKMRSDFILRQSAQQVDDIKSREAYALLRVIASATGSESYAQVYAKDHSLFINVSSMLRSLVQAGKQPEKNVFTPMSKLEEVAVAAELPHNIESDISYELKTLLVRCIANLLYKNRANQGYALDTQLMPSLFECTNMDARNPLIREWCILAMRNACEECPEIQQLIAGLSKKGPAPNDIMTELNLEMGALRIQPGQ